MSAQYKWKAWAQMPVEAQKAGERLAFISGKKKDQLKPEDVVNDARPKKSTLHPCFEWDDTKAAEAHRRSQANFMLRKIVIIEVDEAENKETEIRAFVVVTEDDSKHYTPILRAMGDGDLRAQVLDRALGEVKVWQQRYSDLHEFAEVFSAIEVVSVKKKPKPKKRKKKAIAA